MVGGTREDLELQYIHCLFPRRSYKDIGRPQGKGDFGADIQADGPLGEGFSGLVWYAKAEGSTRKGRAASGGVEEENAVAKSYHDRVLSGKLRQAFCQTTTREGGGCLLPDDQCTKTG